VDGVLRTEGLAARSTDQDPEQVDVSLIQEVQIKKGWILFLFKDGDWLTCRLMMEDLQIDRGEIWQLVNVATVEKIRLAPGDPPRVISLLPPSAETLPAAAGVPVPAPPVPAAAGVPAPVAVAPAPPAAVAAAPAGDAPPAPAPPVEAPATEVEEVAVAAETAQPEVIEFIPVEDASAMKRTSPWEDNPFRLSLEAGYSLILGSDGDFLKGGGAIGLSFGYEFLRYNDCFLAGEFSFLRSMHSGKGALSGVKQNANPFMFGLRGGYRMGRHEFSLKLQTGVLVLDTSGSPGGQDDAIWGLQYGAGYAFGITDWLSVGPELRFTNGIDAGRYTTWFDLLANVSVHF